MYIYTYTFYITWTSTSLPHGASAGDDQKKLDVPWQRMGVALFMGTAQRTFHI